MGSVQLDQVTKQFTEKTKAVDGLSLSVRDGEFLVLVGPSGCGKSTTLRMVAGLEIPTQGEVLIDGKRVTTCSPADRNIAMVFQNYALYPHMSVYKNLSFGLQLQNRLGVIKRGVRFWKRLTGSKHRSDDRRLSPIQVRQRVERVARQLGIEPLLQKRPHQLSGGERQRVALGRAIVREPAVFLFDEPLSNLDAKLRSELRRELKKLHRHLKATMIYVTHDQVEAMTLGGPNRSDATRKNTTNRHTPPSIQPTCQSIRSSIHWLVSHELDRRKIYRRPKSTFFSTWKPEHRRQPHF